MFSFNMFKLSLVPIFTFLFERVATVASLTFEVSRKHKNHNSLCIDGKLAPEFYLLGGKKCATSSMYAQLDELGILNSPRGGPAKEWNFFFEWYAKGKSENLTEQYLDWHSSLLPCPDSGPKQVIGSYGVHFAVEVPLPQGMIPHETLWFREWINPAGQMFGFKNETIQAESLQQTPSVLRAFYGQQASKLVFALLMREPLSRMHSEWYFAQAANMECQACKVGASFQDSLLITIRAMQSSPARVTEWLWKSMWAYMIEGYLNQFDATQMLIIPFKQYTSSKTSRNVCEQIRQRVALDFACWDSPPHANSNSHPSLDGDLTEEVLAMWNSMMAEHNARLAPILATAQLKGTWLAGYPGSSGDGTFKGYAGNSGNEQQIQMWLEEYW